MIGIHFIVKNTKNFSKHNAKIAKKVIIVTSKNPEMISLSYDINDDASQKCKPISE